MAVSADSSAKSVITWLRLLSMQFTALVVACALGVLLGFDPSVLVATLAVSSFIGFQVALWVEPPQTGAGVPAKVGS
jgi:hypothetical protein